VNLHGVVHCVAAFLRPLHDRGEQAQFVMTGSHASFLVVPEIASYVASKHAIWGLADSIQAELVQAGSPVGVSMLAPPRVGTGIVAHTIQKVREQEGDEAAEAFFRELPTPDWIAELTIRKAAAREFLILPNDDFKPMFKARIAELT
jgi:short-subunit dehydrogenase